MSKRAEPDVPTKWMTLDCLVCVTPLMLKVPTAPPSVLICVLMYSSAVQGTMPPSRLGFSLTKVSSMPFTVLIFWPVVKCKRSIACTPMAPMTPPPFSCSFHQECLRPKWPNWSMNCKSTCRSSPIALSSATALRAAWAAFVKRTSWSMIATCFGRSLASFAIASTSATLAPAGLSVSTCFPARNAASECSACKCVGETTETRSTSGQPTRSPMESKAWGILSFSQIDWALALSRL
mmetsp:Transcript_49569/g.106084  ORF Transcript_49569/g.106084 Transcript_49569/m.106084 type:complete len:236 (+) Transcript_49569:238-945(+)